MSIMEKMRGSTDSTPMQIVLVLIVVAFVGWYALPEGEQVNVALEVDGQRILMSEFGPRYQLAKALASAGDRDLSEEQERRLLNDLKQIIARDVVLAHEAARLGYQVSAEEVSHAIKSDPRYFGADGTFDLVLWKDAVKSSGRSRADHEEEIRRRLLRDKLRAAVTLGVAVDERAARAEYEEVLATVDLEYVKVQGDVLAVDDAALSEWSASNEDAVRSEYDRLLPTRFELPATVDLRVIRLQVGEDDGDALRERLDGIRAQAVAGEAFPDLARRWSEDAATVASGGELGERQVSTLTAAIRDAVADLAPGQISPIVDESDRLSLFQLVDRQDARVVPFADAREELALELFRRHRAERAAAEIAQAWGDLPPVELLAELDLQVQSLPKVTAAQYTPELGQPPVELIAQAREAQVGAVLDPFEAPEGASTAWYVARVSGKDAADDEYYSYFLAQKLRLARSEAFEAYASDLQAKAVVDTGEGTATQGGWRDWLSGILPNSGG